MTKSSAMSASEVKDHWKSWANEWGINLRATTKTWTVKALEIDALTRAFEASGMKGAFSVLEAGCGNGMNCFELAKAFPEARFDGFDYIPEMVASANENLKQRKGAIRFFEGDVMETDKIKGLEAQYDVVFTDRCLINLTTPETQKKGISSLAAKVKKGGHFVILENIRKTYDLQNECRVKLGLKPRTPAEFNLFFDEDDILAYVKSCGFEILSTDDFGSLHDLVLYVLVPAINGGEVDYEHPMVKEATMLSIKTSAEKSSAFGQFGQNRLYLCRKI